MISMKWIALFAVLVLISGCVFTTPWGDFGFSGTGGGTPPAGGTGTGGEVSGGAGTSGGPATGTGGAGAGTGTGGSEVSGGESGTSGGNVSGGGASPGGEASGGEIGTPPESHIIGPVSEPTVVYFDPGAGSFMIEIDGIANSFYDRVGVVLRPGESADPTDPNSLFVGDYPAHSPRDLVIASRVMNGNRELEEWRAQTTNGDLQRKNFDVVIQDSGRMETGRIDYERAWPSSYNLAVTSGTFEETLTISSETVEKVE